MLPVAYILISAQAIKAQMAKALRTKKWWKVINR